MKPSPRSLEIRKAGNTNVVWALQPRLGSARLGRKRWEQRLWPRQISLSQAEPEESRAVQQHLLLPSPPPPPPPHVCSPLVAGLPSHRLLRYSRSPCVGPGGRPGPADRSELHFPAQALKTFLPLLRLWCLLTSAARGWVGGREANAGLFQVGGKCGSFE